MSAFDSDTYYPQMMNELTNEIIKLKNSDKELKKADYFSGTQTMTERPPPPPPPPKKHQSAEEREALLAAAAGQQILVSVNQETNC